MNSAARHWDRSRYSIFCSRVGAVWSPPKRGLKLMKLKKTDFILAQIYKKTGSRLDLWEAGQAEAKNKGVFSWWKSLDLATVARFVVIW